jgi:hypothetical protein
MESIHRRGRRMADEVLRTRRTQRLRRVIVLLCIISASSAVNLYLLSHGSQNVCVEKFNRAYPIRVGLSVSRHDNNHVESGNDKNPLTVGS